MQSGPSRLVKDEYSAGVVGGATATNSSVGMEVDAEAGTIQHHPPAPPQYNITLQTGKLYNRYL